jgi:3-phosphoglycerate kinase
MSVIKMADLDLAGKRVLIREDLNVPVKNGKVTPALPVSRPRCPPSSWRWRRARR